MTMTTNNIWEDPEVKVISDYVKFAAEGDTITGRITDIQKHTFDDGTKCAKLILQTTEGEKAVTASQHNLKTQLGELKPSIGDNITITFTNIQKLQGGKTLKMFDVNVEAGNKNEEPLF